MMQVEGKVRATGQDPPCGRLRRYLLQSGHDACSYCNTARLQTTSVSQKVVRQDHPDGRTMRQGELLRVASHDHPTHSTCVRLYSFTTSLSTSAQLMSICI